MDLQQKLSNRSVARKMSFERKDPSNTASDAPSHVASQLSEPSALRPLSQTIKRFDKPLLSARSKEHPFQLFTSSFYSAKNKQFLKNYA